MIPIVVGVSIVDYLYLLLDNPRAQRHLQLMNEPSFGLKIFMKKAIFQQ